MVTANTDEGDNYYDDDTFARYIPMTVDPGYSLLIITTIFTLFSNAILPCLVSMGRRYEKRKIQLNPKTEESVATKISTGKLKMKQCTGDAVECKLDEVASKTEGEPKTNTRYTPDSYVRVANNKVNNTSLKTLLDQIIMPPYPGEGSVVGGSAMLGSRTNPNGTGTPNPVEASSEVAGSEMGRSTLTFLTAKSGATGFSSTHFLDVGVGVHARGRGAPRTRTHRRQRRVLMDKELRRKDQENELDADRREYASLVMNDEMEHAVVATTSELKGHYEAKAVQSEVASRVSYHTNRTTRTTRRRRAEGSAISGTSTRYRGRKRGGGSALSGFSRRHSPEPSVLPPLDGDVISPNDAADANDPGNYILPKADIEGDQDIDFCCGQQAWWQPAMIGAGIDRLINIAEWDHEMKRIIKLTIPFSISGLVGTIASTIDVALVAHYLGTEALVASIVADTLLSFTADFLGGVLATESTLCSHAVGAKNFKLAGQYVQISTLIYIILYIPNMVLWLYFMDDVILLFGFNQATADLALKYTLVQVFDDIILGIIEAWDGLLDVIGFEVFTTVLGVIFEILGVGASAALLIFREETTLVELALLNMCMTVLYILLSIGICVCCTNGRLNKYIVGICGNPFKVDRKTVWHVFSTSIPLSFGYLFEDGEWELLTIFAAYLGPAEVAAWAILGEVWGCLGTLSGAICDAGGVRVGYHLGASNPGMAQISAYKAILVSVIAASFETSILFIVGEDLATWFTPDPALQHMIAELIPLIGLGNITLSAGGVAWAMVGAQARYRLATLVALLASWFVTLPLAAIMTYLFKFNLQGIVSAVVIGYSVSCTTLFYILLRSDWNRISHHIVELNEQQTDESDDESSSDEESSTHEAK
mmetsp:Transcript_32802/g.37315  ORF Transcript_32802/g.37315 Transcript_32802/m.37315 type:complete len:878 (+) Transcript_32802:172-2805(+)|eukprot:CAMPEP_0194130862 /NCGR_PEP_ID=MMETSP0152-20130528/1780_1 /TAXON_ID=1049557 /ORGANISM="Thalassiothrix antarctica, Strain L6-D1" /LENGTH=877 /DNA_ID=CAMNT_0038825481 /DNA_START=33 /DNA_END=2666 /DNA_ORIENTATION=-